MAGFNWLAVVMLWLTGLGALLFPHAVLGYSRWKHRHQPHWVQSTTSAQIRTVASAYLTVLIGLTFFWLYRSH